MAIKNAFLNDQRINRVVRKIEDELRLNEKLTYLGRVPRADVYSNRDITATYGSRIFAADIIMNDSRARVVQGATLEAAALLNYVPNIKIGKSITQEQLERLDFIERGLRGSAGDTKEEIIRFEQLMARDLVHGVRQTMNMLCAAMYLDTVVYDRFGMDLGAGSSFGTPADLKSTLTGTDTWVTANLTTFDAIDDIQEAANYARVTYGSVYDRADMSTAKFQLIIQSDAFKSHIRTYMGLEATDPVALTANNIAQAQRLFELISGFKLYLDDSTMLVQLDDISEVSTRILPNEKVILSSSGDDNDESKFDFAQAIPEELTVGRLTGNGPDISTSDPGILSYYEGTMNPPSATAWAVVKGYPRKHNKYVNSVITTE